MGEIKCITGTVIRVKQGARGVHFLDFCDDFRLCPFTVVIFPSDLKSVGDVRQLQGRMIEIHGKVKEYDGRAEIVLEEYRQLSGSGARIPPLPKNYDVEKKGRYSAGTFSHPKSKRKTSKRQPAEDSHPGAGRPGTISSDSGSAGVPPARWAGKARQVCEH